MAWRPSAAAIQTELSAVVRDLALSPLASSDADRQVSLYLFLLVVVYSLPLWAQSLWVELTRNEREAAILILRSRTSLDFIYFQF